MAKALGRSQRRLMRIKQRKPLGCVMFENNRQASEALPVYGSTFTCCGLCAFRQ